MTVKKKCPYCGSENLAGVDLCANCRHFLTHEDLPKPGPDKLQKAIMKDPVKNFISKVPPIFVAPDTTLAEVIRRMQDNPTKGCVLICENENLVGIASIRDILLKVAGKIQDRTQIPVSTIMTPNPECLEKEMPLSYALHKMSIGKFRHVPVLDGGKPIGVVSTRDIIEYLAE